MYMALYITSMTLPSHVWTIFGIITHHFSSHSWIQDIILISSLLNRNINWYFIVCVCAWNGEEEMCNILDKQNRTWDALNFINVNFNKTNRWVILRILTKSPRGGHPKKFFFSQKSCLELVFTSFEQKTQFFGLLVCFFSLKKT